MDVGLLVLRIVVGALFAGHGAQKLFGWFGGFGIRGFGGFLESLGYRPGTFFAVVTGLAELGGGLLLATGFATPLGAAAVVGVMINAILTAKRSAGLWGGYELDLLYAVAATALAFVGAGAYSVDRALDWTLSGTEWGIGALALAVVVGGLTLAIRRPAPATETQAEPQGAV